MKFTEPIALLLLLLMPYFFWLGRPKNKRSQTLAWVSLALRLLIVLLIIFGLAGTQIVRAADELAIVFLVDASDSISQDQSELAEKFVRDAIERISASEQAAVILFGDNALVERPMSGLAELAPISSVPKTLNTDIAKAIRLGLALFPSGKARRIVLLSDGLATKGESLRAASLAAASGVQIDVVSLGESVESPEAMLISVDAPTQVNVGEAFSIEVTVDSNQNIPANMLVVAGDGLIHEQVVNLRPGINRFSIPIRAQEQEFSRYLVQINPENDTISQNNQLATFTNVSGPPRILIVDGKISNQSESGEGQTSDPLPSAHLIQALEVSGLAADLTTPQDLSPALTDLGNYDAVIFVNVNAKDLTLRKMLGVKSYVRDLGGGLVAIGGPESFGMGGYFRTPLEEVLPVDMQIKDQERFPAVSLAVVIDRSGSMAAQEDGVAKIQLAAEGAVRVAELMNDFDEITIIPVDTAADQVIGPAMASDREQIIAQTRLIGAGGGGIYVRTGLEAAVQVLSQSENQVKHIILLADGADAEQKDGVPELISSLREQNITVSTVSIGNGPDVQWLEEMATIAGGRFHFTDRAANLPQIFTQETTNIQRSYLVEELFFPSLADSPFSANHAIVRSMRRSGIDNVPALNGYIATSPKTSSQVLLESDLDDPILAAWEYGLGRSVAWTSDATGHWATSWVDWENFSEFWSAVVRWSLSRGGLGNFDIDIDFNGIETQIMVDAQDRFGQLINDLEVNSSIIEPNGGVQPLTFEQIGPGLYSTNFQPQSEGAYLIRITAESEEGQTSMAETTGWVLGYSPEYRQDPEKASELDTLAEVTSGRQLDLTDDGDILRVLDHSLQSGDTSRPIWSWLLTVAVILLPLDVASRRLVLTARDLRRAWMNIKDRLPSRDALPTVRSDEVARLLQVKKITSSDLSDPEQSRLADDAGSVQSTISSTMAVDEEPIISSDIDTTEQETPDTLASRLLESKRRQSQDDPD